MGILDDLQQCINALESMKNGCLEKSLSKEYELKGVADVIAGQYIAYASCQSILLDLLEKYQGNLNDNNAYHTERKRAK